MLSHFSNDWQFLCRCQEADCSSSATALCAWVLQSEPLGAMEFVATVHVVCSPAGHVLWSHPFLCQRFIASCFSSHVSHPHERSKNLLLQCYSAEWLRQRDVCVKDWRQAVPGLSPCTGGSESYTCARHVYMPIVMWWSCSGALSTVDYSM